MKLISLLTALLSLTCTVFSFQAGAQSAVRKFVSPDGSGVLIVLPVKRGRALIQVQDSSVGEFRGTFMYQKRQNTYWPISQATGFSITELENRTINYKDTQKRLWKLTGVGDKTQNFVEVESNPSMKAKLVAEYESFQGKTKDSGLAEMISSTASRFRSVCKMKSDLTISVDKGIKTTLSHFMIPGYQAIAKLCSDPDYREEVQSIVAIQWAQATGDRLEIKRSKSSLKIGIPAQLDNALYAFKLALEEAF